MFFFTRLKVFTTGLCSLTNQFLDGTSIKAVLHQLATHTLPLCFFATHYGSLTDDYAYHPNIRNMHMSTLVDDEKCEVSLETDLSVEKHCADLINTTLSSTGVMTHVATACFPLQTCFRRRFFFFWNTRCVSRRCPTQRRLTRSAHLRGLRRAIHRACRREARIEDAPTSCSSGCGVSFACGGSICGRERRLE